MGKLSLKRKLKLGAQCSGSVLLFALAITVNCVGVYYNEPLSQALGVIGVSQGTGKTYFESDYSSQDEALKATDKVIQKLVGEGSVLLKNDNNTLPLSTSSQQKAKVSLLGIASYNLVTSGSGSGSTTAKGKVSLSEAMENANFEVNPTLLDFYKTCSDEGYGTGSGTSQAVGGLVQKLSEVPNSKYATNIVNSFSNYNDAAIVVIGRSGSEGVDLSRNLASLNSKRKEDIAAYENEQHYLELTKEEKDLIKLAHANFDKVIVLVNSPSAMELGFLDDEEYGVGACLWIGAPGNTGINAVANILAGNINPSGRLVDTYVYDNFSSPAVQNFGDYKYGNENYFYVTYQEGIYVGYKYYETRYEDYVLNQGNAGEYDYSSTVQFPFGYGLSYSDYEWDNFTCTDNGDTLTLTVDVSNLSSTFDGKEVVEAYVSAPYYENGIEKASVNLVGFDKVSVEKGGKTTAKIEVNKKDFASYDNKNEKTYVLEKGKYYVTLARNAHEATNNILAKKSSDGTSVDNTKLVGEGDGNFVSSINVEETMKYSEGENGFVITNQFDDADLTNEACPAYDPNFKYLSRSNWTDTFPTSYSTGKNTIVSNNKSGFVETREPSEKLLTALKLTGIEGSKNPNINDEVETLNFGQKGDRELIELIGKAYDDPVYKELISQASIDDISKMISSSGYQTMAIQSVGKPKTYDFDGPAGLTSFFTSVKASAFPVQALMGSTWNVDLMEEAGRALGNEALWAKSGGRVNGINGWYAPGINIHRTPFGGRNFEYYSEDGFLTGALASSQIKGVQSKGIFCYMKHFALNDQESNRSCSGNVSNDDGADKGGLGLVTWANEQAIREIYLKPFEMAIKDNKDKTLGVMTSFNRIGATWTGGSYQLITNVLRNEWGFNGGVITDYWEGEYMVTMQMLAAGGDIMLISASNPSTKVTNTDSKFVQQCLANSLHHVLYMVGNSSAMNGVSLGANLGSGFPNYYFIIIALYVVAALGTALLMTFGIRGLLKDLKELKIEVK